LPFSTYFTLSFPPYKALKKIAVDSSYLTRFLTQELWQGNLCASALKASVGNILPSNISALKIPHLYCGKTQKFRIIIAENKGVRYTEQWHGTSLNRYPLKTGCYMKPSSLNSNISRIAPIEQDLKKSSVLLLGPRRTGKSFFIRHQLQADRVYNLLRADTYQQLSARPSLIRESLQKSDKLIVIDEVQKLPILMDEVHLMIEETNIRFLLTGSSARKLRRTHTSLMAGRAKVRHLFPFVSAELSDWNLDRILTYGTLPPAYLDEHPDEVLASYAGEYLREEIMAEAMVRKIDNFSRFLHRAALSNGELLNFESVASDAQVPPRTVREYYAILVDTLVGTMLEPIDLGGKRKSTAHGKFFFFDVGVVNALQGDFNHSDNHPRLGIRFEHFVFQELRAYVAYRHPSVPLNFWRTPQGHEVDFILNKNIAIEAKASRLVTERDLKPLQLLAQETRLRRKIVVSRDEHARTLGDIEIIPIGKFLEMLWADQIL
jgi:predicted AAA+ superfamily ATPase